MSPTNTVRQLTGSSRQSASDPNKNKFARRKPYNNPMLRHFGPVGMLTQAGSGLDSEAMSNGMFSMSPKKRA